MTKIQNIKQYDLEDRTAVYAEKIRKFIKFLPRTLINQNDISQLIRSSGSVGANYIEANEALSKKDFTYRIKICRKEAKESKYWLRLLIINEKELAEERHVLLDETDQLTKFFGSIVEKSK